MRDVAVIGVGLSQWGELWDRGIRDLFTEAGTNAIDNAGVDKVEAIFVGCMSGGMFTQQEHIGAMVADYLGLAPIPATRTESACASAGTAFRAGLMAVASGYHDVVMVGGVEKMTDVDGAGATTADDEDSATRGAPFAIQNDQDAPPCSTCGSIMIRNGSCYKCVNCGATSGCA